MYKVIRLKLKGSTADPIRGNTGIMKGSSNEKYYINFIMKLRSVSPFVFTS